MKRFSSLLIGLMLLGLPLVASAAEPLSPALKQVFARADREVELAEQTGFLAEFAEEAVPDWIRDGLTAVFAPIDTEHAVVQESESFTDSTACLRYDRILVNAKLKDIHNRMEVAEQQSNIYRLLHLKSAYDFLSNARTALLAGALDPDVHYEQWTVPMLGEQEDGETFNNDVCFFNSDYAAPALPDPNIDGTMTGCDAELLQKIESASDSTPFFTTVTAERQAEAEAETALKRQLSTEHTFGLLESVDNLVSDAFSSTSSTSSISSSSSSNWTHTAQSGCDASVGETTVLRPVRDAFSIERNDIELLKAFLQLKGRTDRLRSAPSAFEWNTENALEDLPSIDRIALVRAFSENQSNLEAATFAASTDPGLALEDAFAELRDAASALARIGSAKQGGLREFVLGLAYFLDRSCLDRSCGERLDAIIALSLTDECFPYGKGGKRETDPASPQWKKCLCAAIPEDSRCGE